MFRYGIQPSPFGHCLVIMSGDGICRLSFLDSADHGAALSALGAPWRSRRMEADPGAAAAVVRLLFGQPEAGADQGHDGAAAGREITVQLGGSRFQRRVWCSLLRISPGTVVSYEDVAVSIGHGNAARAVGTALRSNPVAYVIPCHRVIRKDGSPGGYGGGLERKLAMLEWEAMVWNTPQGAKLP